MEELDSDDKPLENDEGVAALRDIVQFVPMRDYKDNLKKLSKVTLAEIPQQFKTYVEYHGILPKGKSKANENNLKFDCNDNDEKDNNFELKRLPTKMPKINHLYDDAPLPPGWERGYDLNGNMYYINGNNGNTQWKHPNDK